VLFRSNLFVYHYHFTNILKSDKIKLPPSNGYPYCYYDLHSFFETDSNKTEAGETYFEKRLPIEGELFDINTNARMPLYENYRENRNPFKEIENINTVLKHKRYNILHTEKKITVFATINDTTLMIKDIDMNVLPQVKYSIRGQMYNFSYIEQFIVFNIGQNDYLVNDKGEVFIIPIEESRVLIREDIFRRDADGNKVSENRPFTVREDRKPILIGNFIFEKGNNLFYLIDNDSEQIYFSCPFVALSKEYEELVGYIDSEHWLYKQYNKIKGKYLEKNKKYEYRI
jgi:hypothetical protein